jgi:hypothetical protein
MRPQRSTSGVLERREADGAKASEQPIEVSLVLSVADAASPLD